MIFKIFIDIPMTCQPCFWFAERKTGKRVPRNSHTLDARMGRRIFWRSLEELRRTVWGPWNIPNPLKDSPCRIVKGVLGISYRFLMDALKNSNYHQMMSGWFIKNLLRRPHRIPQGFQNIFRSIKMLRSSSRHLQKIVTESCGATGTPLVAIGSH